MDTIFIHNLKSAAVIGTCPAERAAGPQPIWIDVEVGVDISSAVKRDQLADTVDYTILAEYILRFVDRSCCRLLEALAANLADAVLEEFKAVESLCLTLRKPNALAYTDNVGIRVERCRANPK